MVYRKCQYTKLSLPKINGIKWSKKIYPKNRRHKIATNNQFNVVGLLQTNRGCILNEGKPLQTLKCLIQNSFQQTCLCTSASAIKSNAEYKQKKLPPFYLNHDTQELQNLDQILHWEDGVISHPSDCQQNSLIYNILQGMQTVCNSATTEWGQET